MSKTNFYNKKHKPEPYSTNFMSAQVKITNALLIFCSQHEHPENPHLKSIQLCLESLKENNILNAVKHYQEVPLGGNGCFNDWWPPVVYENETEEYISTVFKALTAYWSHIMNLSVEK